jgi:prepilin-type N-terminal cleavage/methylation domain-containing protein
MKLHQRMRIAARKAFTLIELLIVIGIIAILAGILLPAVNHMRHNAQITSQKADFQTISAALEQYREDFGDYPRNAQLQKWNTQNGAVPAPVYLSLAAALLGPGPAVTSATELGDGNDGFGFRCEATSVVPGTASIAAGQNMVTFNADAAYATQYTAFKNNFVSSTATPACIAFIENGTASPYYSETLGINSIQNQFTTVTNATYTHSGRALLSIPGGKVWGPYISADTFKVAFVPQQLTDNATYVQYAGEPLLLDRWGQVIQYFPRYGPANNRIGSSTHPGDSTLSTSLLFMNVQIGPLVGYAQPKSIDATYGEDSIWDEREGSPFFSSNISQTLAGQGWIATGSAGSYFDPNVALEWMLGCNTPNGTNNGLADVIAGSDRPSYDGPFILISAGPDGPARANGGFCNFLNTTTGTLTDPSGNNLTRSELQQAFTNSGNVYNFDRP